MEQLNGVDASFLNMETATAHSHVGSLALFDPSEVPMTIDTVKQVIAERLHEIPPYRRRLMTVPLGLDRPYWIEDDAFDLDFHIRHIAVPAPGDRYQLADLVARLHSRPLDRAKPLWELYVIEGLDTGLVAHYTKIHHACIDGVTGTEILTTVLDVDPEGRPPKPEVMPWSPDRVPSSLEMLGRGVAAITTQPGAQLRFQRRMTRAAMHNSRRQMGPVMTNLQEALRRTPGIGGFVPEPREDEHFLSRPAAIAPRLSFNRSITAHRRYAFGSLPLDDVKEIKEQYGFTVNDVVMAICAGALRTWLNERHELPTDPTLAMVPVSVRTGDIPGSYGNEISAMVAALPTNEADPLVRLRLAHESMRIAKEEHAALPADLLQDFGRFAPPAVAARVARVVARTRLADVANPQFNLVISNIPGPQYPLYCSGTRQVATYPIPVINNGVGLNITLMSYNGELHFGMVACREAVGELWGLMDAIDQALGELLKAARDDRTNAEETS